MDDDIVARLREGFDRRTSLVSNGITSVRADTQLMKEAADEIERLRAAGDALVAAIRNHMLSEKDIRAWEEARRG